MPEQTKYPILLRNKCDFTKLIILKCHDEVFHNGASETLAQMRAKFWITKGRQNVKMIIRRCNICKRLEGGSYGRGPIASLPEYRVTGGQAFQAIGIDFAGPLYIRSEKGESKCYILIVTCASSRMVHLEVCSDMTTVGLIKCLKRFSARRGRPSLIISDNAKTFKSKELKIYLANLGINWRFNLAKASWWGGFFERLIRSTKRCLKKCLGNARLNFEDLTTTLTEIEAVLNSRPLTYLDPDSSEILTPSHLYIGRRILDPPIQKANIDQLTGDLARNQVKITKGQLERFWKIWEKEYLLSLRENFVCKNKLGPSPEIGDIVMVQNENKKRHLWLMGKIDKLIGREGEIRGARVKVSKEGKKTGYIERPLEKLFPLEMGQPRDDDIETVDRRERRKAAKIGEESRRVRDHLYNELEG